MSSNPPRKDSSVELTAVRPRDELAPTACVDRDAITQVPCPACATCIACKGAGAVDCFECIHVHIVDCVLCAACSYCGGTHLVTPDQAQVWRDSIAAISEEP